jgi:hypothetical protein
MAHGLGKARRFEANSLFKANRFQTHRPGKERAGEAKTQSKARRVEAHRIGKAMQGEAYWLGKTVRVEAHRLGRERRGEAHRQVKASRGIYGSQGKANDAREIGKAMQCKAVHIIKVRQRAARHIS